MSDLIIDPTQPRLMVEHLDPRKMLILAQLAQFAGKDDLALGCSRCQSQFVGKNAVEDSRWTIRCNCRELTSDLGAVNKGA